MDGLPKWAAPLALEPPERPAGAGETAALPPPAHIVHVITRLLRGGAEENTVSTCLYQAARGSRVTLVHGAEAHPSWAARLAGTIDLVTVESIGQAIDPLRDRRAVRDLRALFAELRPDVVHTHQSKAGVLGRLAAARAGVPMIVHTVHIAPFVNVFGLQRWGYLAAEKYCARHTDLLIAVSEGMRDACVRAGVGSGRRFEVVHSGMPLEKFVAAGTPADWRERIGGWEAATRPTFLVMLAAFEPRKRQGALIDAIAPALRARRDLCLVLAGEGSERAQCEARAHSLGIAGQVRFPGHDPAPHELIALADVCLLTSEREGLPRSAVQYIAGGTPVVIARLPGIEELVVDGVNGVITAPDDLGDFVAQLLRLLDDRPRLARLAEGARATDVSRWREEAMGERVEEAYRRTRPDAPIAAIEFFGLPGSGKTCIARNVWAALYDERGDTLFSGDVMGDGYGLLRRTLRRLWLVAKTLPRHPLVALRGARSVLGARAGARDAIKSSWNAASVLAMGLRHRRRGHGILVLDQGPVQAEWSARLHGTAPPGAATDTLPALDKLDRTLFVMIEVPTEVARARLSARTMHTARMQRPECIDDMAMWRRGDRILGGLADTIDPMHLIRVRNDDGTDPSGVAQAIVAEVRRRELGV